MWYTLTRGGKQATVHVSKLRGRANAKQGLGAESSCTYFPLDTRSRRISPRILMQESSLLAQKRDVWVKFLAKCPSTNPFLSRRLDHANLVLDPYGTFRAEDLAMTPSRLIGEVINIKRVLLSKRITTFPPEIHENIDYTQVFMAVVALTSENTKGYIWSISDAVNRKDNFSRVRTGMLLPAFKHAHFYFVNKLDDAYVWQQNMNTPDDATSSEYTSPRSLLLLHGSRKWKMQGSNDGTIDGGFRGYAPAWTNNVEAIVKDETVSLTMAKVTVSSFSTCGLWAVVHYSEEDGMSATHTEFYQGILHFCFTALGFFDYTFWLTPGSSMLNFVDQALFLGKFRDGRKIKSKHYNRKIEEFLLKVIKQVFAMALSTGAFSAPMYIPYFLAICNKMYPNYHRFVVTLQKHWRGHRGRTRAERKRELKQKHDEHMANEFRLEREKEQARHKLAVAERERKKMDLNNCLPSDLLARPQHGKKQWNQKKQWNRKTKMHKNNKNTIKTAEFEHDDFVSPEHRAHRKSENMTKMDEATRVGIVDREAKMKHKFRADEIKRGKKDAARHARHPQGLSLNAFIHTSLNTH